MAIGKTPHTKTLIGKLILFIYLSINVNQSRPLIFGHSYLQVNKTKLRYPAFPYRTLKFKPSVRLIFQSLLFGITPQIFNLTVLIKRR